MPNSAGPLLLTGPDARRSRPAGRVHGRGPAGPARTRQVATANAPGPARAAVRRSGTTPGMSSAGVRGAMRTHAANNSILGRRWENAGAAGPIALSGHSAQGRAGRGDPDGR